MSTSYLVNIVANDFKDGQSIFQPFLLEHQSGLTNGHKEVVNGFRSLRVNGHANGH